MTSGPDRPFGSSPSRPYSSPTRRRGPLVPTLIVLGLLVIGFVYFSQIYADVLWYNQLGFLEVFVTENLSRVGLFVTAFLIMGASVYLSLRIAYAPVLRGIVRARGHAIPADGQEDIVQEVLLAIHVKRHTWREDRPLRPWLWAIARHKVSDAFRARGAHVHLDLDDFKDVLADEPGPDPTAGRDAHRFIDRLDPRAAEIVRRVSLDGEEPAKTGQRLRMSEGAVRVALHRALKRLTAMAQETLR